MKIIVLSMMLLTSVMRVNAQTTEVKQLLLNVEKLAQFKQLLADMKKGYQVLSKGYSTIKNISQGNFSLHQIFLDGLMEVSPAVRRYKKSADIVRLQVQLVKEYKSAAARFRQQSVFSGQELDHISKLYTHVFEASLRNLDDLLMVITAGQLRMSDDERLETIDRIYKDVQEKLVFLRHFNNSTSILAIQRAKEQQDVNSMRKLYDIRP